MGQHALPNFVILGAAKAGTTALYHYFRQHPQIYMTPCKETNFFALAGTCADFKGPGDDWSINSFSITNRQAYEEQFYGANGEIAIGEATPLYLYNAKAAVRLHEAVPDARLIAILRNPIDRAYSAFLHLVREHRETTRDFAEGLKLEDERIRAGYEHIWHYKSMGLYYEQVKRYFDLFGRDQVRVYLYFDLRTEPERLLRDAFGFIGVDDEFMPDISQRHNEAGLPPDQRPPLLPQVRRELQAAMSDDILKLQDLLQRDLSRWLQPVSAEQEGK